MADKKKCRYNGQAETQVNTNLKFDFKKRLSVPFMNLKDIIDVCLQMSSYLGFGNI